MSENYTTSGPDEVDARSDAAGDAEPGFLKVTDRPVYQLHPPLHVALAAALGGPLAGCILLAFNYRALGRYRELERVTVAGVAVGFGTFIFLVPSLYQFDAAYVLSLLFLLDLTLASILTYLLAHFLQGRLYRQHRRQGGGNAPLWLALVAGVGSAAVFVIFYFTTRSK